MILQPVALRRCASCERWQGPRQATDDGQAVRIPGEDSSGLCAGGPWDGSERRARAACGRWLRWHALPPTA